MILTNNDAIAGLIAAYKRNPTNKTTTKQTDGVFLTSPVYAQAYSILYALMYEPGWIEDFRKRNMYFTGNFSKRSDDMNDLGFRFMYCLMSVSVLHNKTEFYRMIEDTIVSLVKRGGFDVEQAMDFFQIDQKEDYQLAEEICDLPKHSRLFSGYLELVDIQGNQYKTKCNNCGSYFEMSKSDFLTNKYVGCGRCDVGEFSFDDAEERVNASICSRVNDVTRKAKQYAKARSIKNLKSMLHDEEDFGFGLSKIEAKIANEYLTSNYLFRDEIDVIKFCGWPVVDDVELHRVGHEKIEGLPYGPLSTCWLRTTQNKQIKYTNHQIKTDTGEFCLAEAVRRLDPDNEQREANKIRQRARRSGISVQECYEQWAANR